MKKDLQNIIKIKWNKSLTYLNLLKTSLQLKPKTAHSHSLYHGNQFTNRIILQFSDILYAY